MFDLMGRQLDRHIHDGELVLSTAVSGDRFALVGSGEARIYGTDGRLVQTIKDGSSARFVGDGTRGPRLRPARCRGDSPSDSVSCHSSAHEVGALGPCITRVTRWDHLRPQLLPRVRASGQRPGELGLMGHAPGDRVIRRMISTRSIG